MTPRQADKIIKEGKKVTVMSTQFTELLPDKLFVRRDRWNIYSEDGGVYDRGDLEIITQ